MKLHLNYPFNPIESPIDIGNKIVSIGSCFAENIAQKLAQFKFNVLLNPNGIVFNPSTIFTQLNNYLDNNNLTEKQLVQHDGLWHSLQHHGSFSCKNKEELVTKINTSTNYAHTELLNANYLMITFGSAYAYQYIPTKSIVANNHKIDGQLFNKILLNSISLKAEFDLFFKKLIQVNPSIKIIFTVSPVRYIRDGLYENNVSKAILHQLVYDIIQQNTSNCFYFPAYEIVIDELRDYRFYKADFVHPNELAIDYVWQKFVSNCLTISSQHFITDYEKYLLLTNHKPLHTDSLSYQKYLDQIINLQQQLNSKYSFLNLK